jgi:hypothetical protein
MNVFKVTIVQYWLHDCWIDAEGNPCAEGTAGARFVRRRKVQAGTPGARKVKKKSTKWYGRLPGGSKPVPLSSNKVAAQQMLAERVKKAEFSKAGIVDPFEPHRTRPLLDHLADYRRALDAKGNDPRHVSIVISRLTDLLTGCGFRLMADLSAARVADWLADLRVKGRPSPALDPTKTMYTPKEAAAVLGIKSASVGVAVRRYRLQAVGQSRKRRFPRATVEALQARLCQGVSVETSNQYLGHAKAFCRWLVKNHRMADNPLAHLGEGNVQTDRRHDRRELTAEELRRLLAVTRSSERAFRGLDGRDRFHLYASACGTGFRASALASLIPESFDLDGDTPTVTLAARENKSRKTKVQPIPADVADLLRDYLKGKAHGQPVWAGSGTWARDGKGAEMLRLDLEDAGIPYAVEGPDGPL